MKRPVLVTERVDIQLDALVPVVILPSAGHYQSGGLRPAPEPLTLPTCRTLGVWSYGGCFEEAVNSLADELRSIREAARAGQETGHEKTGDAVN